MKVKHLVLAVIGAAAMSGCQNEVMGNRGYVPAPSPDNPAPMTAEARTAPESQTPGTAVQSAETAPAAPAEKSAAPRFEPMTGVVSSGGVDSAKGAKRGRKGAAVETAQEGGVYVVQSGDFPEKIARKLHVRLGDLMKANNLTPESAKRLRIGQKLTIPGKTAAPEKGSGKKASGKGGKAAKNDKSAAAEVKDGVYVVQPGDFPEKIARKLHVKLGDLMKANDLTPEKASRLQIGQKLVVPGKTAAPAKAEAKSAKKDAAPAKKQNGDSAELTRTLNEAAEAPVTPAPAAAPDAPAAETSVSAPHPANGEVVVNGESHVVVVEDNEVSVEEFARRNNTTVDTLRKLNPDLKPDTTSFKKNEVVFVPGAGK